MSVLDRCQYQCPYCRPGSLAPFVERDDRLTPGDYRRLAPTFAELGVSKVRLTGGEPLLRKDLPEVVAALREGLPDAALALTTNGQLLAERLGALVSAGLSRATVHVDSLRRDRYRALMGDGDVERVLRAALDARAHLREVKLNVVVQRGKNDDEIPDFLAWSRSTGVEVRFIELMNTGSATAYTQRVFFSGREIVGAVRRHAGATPVPRAHASDPAAKWRTDDGLVFGVIASDTEPFCGDCDRMRLTADGVLLGCLYQARGVDLGRSLRQGDDARTRALVLGAFASKTSHHPMAGAERERAVFSMAQTGG